MFAILFTAAALGVSQAAPTMESLSASGAGSFHRAPVLISDALSARLKEPFEAIEGHGRPWLHSLYLDALRLKAARGNEGFCGAAQAVYRYNGVGQNPGTERLYLLAMDAVKKTMAAAAARDYPGAETKIKVIIAGRTNVADGSSVRRYIGRVLEGNSDSVADRIFEHEDEFARPAKRAFIHTDAAYVQTPAGGGAVLQSVLRFMVFFDLERGELSLVGDGECEF